jgi:tetratricopeptide (TPR) repeat protein
LDLWDYLVAAAVALLVFFTPFASGGVTPGATGVAEALCFVLAILWLGKSLLSGGAGFPSLARREFRSLVMAAGAFLVFLAFQLVPLPPPLIKILSPHSYELYQSSIPGWPDAPVYADAAYVHPTPPRNGSSTVVVLPTVEEVRGGVAVPFAPGRAASRSTADSAPLAVSVWRSLSVAPTLTRASILKCAAYAALFLVIVFYPAGAGDARTERHFRRLLLLIILASGAAVAVAGLTQQAFSYTRSLWAEVAAGAGADRASGPFANPDHFANYLAMLLPLAAAGALFRVPLDPLQQRFSGFQLLCAAFALLIAAAILISLSRAGWIEIGLGIFVFAWLLRSRLRYREEAADSADAHRRKALRGPGWFLPLGIGLVAVAIVPLFLIGPGERQQAGARVDESVASGVGFWDRIDMWVDSGAIVHDYPVFGSGSDSWPAVFPKYQRPPWSKYFSGEAQNDYVEVAAECGIVGLVLLGWLCWEIGRFLKAGALWVPSRHWPLFAALIPALVIMAFHESLDFCMQIPANAILFVILLAMALRLARTHGSSPLGRQPGRAATIAVPAAIGLAAVAGLAAIPWQRETVYPNDLAYPASIHDNEASIVAHPASAIPHLWLAERIHNATGVWLDRELQAAIWLDPTNPAGRDRYVQALLSEGKRTQALGEISRAVYLAPALSDHGYLNTRIIPWLSRGQRDAIRQGLREAQAGDFEGSTDGLAQLYLAEGRPLKAASVYEAAAQRETDSARKFEYSLDAGTAYAQALNRSQAEKLLLAAARINPDDPRPYGELITMVYGPEHNAAAATGVIRTAVNNGADPAPLYLALQNAASASGDGRLAEAALREAVQADPSFANWMRLGSFYVQQEKYASANQSIRRALEINPESGEAYFLRAQAEEGAYQYPAASSDYQRAVTLAPDNAEFKSRRRDLLQKIAEDTGKPLDGHNQSN